MYSYIFIYISKIRAHLELNPTSVCLFFFFNVLFWAFSTLSGIEATSWSPGVKHLEAKPFKVFQIATIP